MNTHDYRIWIELIFFSFEFNQFFMQINQHFKTQPYRCTCLSIKKEIGGIIQLRTIKNVKFNAKKTYLLKNRKKERGKKEIKICTFYSIAWTRV